MTTIAWDGKTLAADSQTQAGGLRNRYVKAHRTSNGYLFASAGEMQANELVRLWIERGMPEDGKPSVSQEFTAILICPDGAVRTLEDKLVQMPVFDRFHAIGSGRDYAIAAMHLGKDAVGAIEVAAVFDIYTGGEIIALSLAP